jgi:hypothetical protein
MPDLFESSHRKIARAKEHITEFDSRWQSFCDQPNLYEPFIDKDPERPGKDIWKLRLNHPFPTTLDEIIGDAVNNLRSALDHACYAAAVASGNSTPRYAYFPFGKTEPDFEITMKGNSKDVPPAIQTIIRNYRPYKGGNDPFRALNLIAVRDKHMRLSQAGMRLMNGFKGSGGGRVRFPVDPIWDHGKNEVEFAEFTTGEHFKFRFEFTPFVSFGEIEGIAGDPVSAVLDWFVQIVEHAVASIEEESRRLFPATFD